MQGFGRPIVWRVAACLIAAAMGFFAQVVEVNARGPVAVRGYFRSNGTYVQPHYRSAPDGSFYNNWSTYGNVNPYTGEVGTKTNPAYSRSTLRSYVPSLPSLPSVSVSREPARALVPGTSNSESDPILGSRPRSALSRREAIAPQKSEAGAARASSAQFVPLSPEERSSILATCSARQRLNEMAARECVAYELAALDDGARTPYMGGIATTERASIAMACYESLSRGALNYNRCLRDRLWDLAVAPALPNLSVFDQTHVRLSKATCDAVAAKGPGAHNKCIVSQMQRHLAEASGTPIALASQP